MGSPVDQILKCVRTRLAEAAPDAALRELGEFVRFVNAPPSRWGRIMAAPDLDTLCGEIAGKLPAAPAVEEAIPADGAHCVFIATELYGSGGHTGWVRDVIAARPDSRHTVLLTDLHNRTNRERLASTFTAANVELHWAPPDDWLARCQWLRGWLAGVPQADIYLVCHQEDSPAIAAAMASGHRRLHFIHHADYTLALGMHLPGAAHVDLTSFTYHHCREVWGVQNSRYLPLMSRAGPARSAADFHRTPADQGFTTCSCGPGQKFDFPYDFRYTDLIPQMLARTAGTHLHIGSVSDGFLDAVREKCQELGVAADRFRHLAGVPALGPAMHEHGVDLYIGSFPVTGAKSTIDVLGSGTPVLCHVNYMHEYLGGQCLVPAGMPLWRTPEEFFAAVASLTPEHLSRLGAAGRAHWEQFHSPEIFAGLLERQIPADFVPGKPASTGTDALRLHLEPWDAADAWDTHQQDLGRMQRRLEKAGRELMKARTTTDKARSRRDDAEKELAAIRSLRTWRGMNWLFRAERSLRRRFGR